MKVIETEISDLFIVEHDIASDKRGVFAKIYKSTSSPPINFKGGVAECFYTMSRKDVIRGMHFQLPPHAQSKLVTAVTGEIEDVVLDLRKGSHTYLKTFCIRISNDAGFSIHVPVGLAHGFKALRDESIVLYLTSSSHNPESDYGIRYDSFGYDWKLHSPVVSERDLNLPMLKDFETPF